MSTVRLVRGGSIAAALRSVHGNAALFRVLAAYTSFSVGEFGIWITLLVYAYDKFGATGATAIVLAQLLPSAALAPLTGTVADRRTPAKVLRWTLIGQALALGALGANVAAGGPPSVVFVLAAAFTLILDVTRPAQAALLPEIVRTPAELTTANAVSAWIDGIGSLGGPAVAGVAVSLGGIDSGVVVAAALNAVGALLVAAPLGLPLGAPDVAMDAAAASEEGRAEGVGEEEVEAEGVGAETSLLAGLRSTLSVPETRVILVLNACYYTLIGAIDVLCVVLAVSLLHLGSGDAGYLNACVGGGATAAGAITLALAGRHRLASLAAASLLAAVAALAFIDALPTVASAVVLLAVIGFAGTVFLASSRILLQRVAPADGTGATFAVMEGVMSFGLAAGAVVVRVGIAVGGLRGGLVAPAILGAALISFVAPRLRAVDAAAVVPHVEMRLLRSIPIFAPLPSPALEGVARELHEVPVNAGTVVVTEDETGDRYYAVAHGRLRVTRAGTLLRMLGRGDGFGEIALLTASRRTATVTAESNSLLYSLGKDSFLRVLTGHRPARSAAEGVISTYDDPEPGGIVDS